jgi:hypothetical protein
MPKTAISLTRSFLNHPSWNKPLNPEDNLEEFNRLEEQVLRISSNCARSRLPQRPDAPELDTRYQSIQ